MQTFIVYHHRYPQAGFLEDELLHFIGKFGTFLRRKWPEGHAQLTYTVFFLFYNYLLPVLSPGISR
ncbi:hypothetical protein ES703_111082 [subsurface metagenome]